MLRTVRRQGEGGGEITVLIRIHLTSIQAFLRPVLPDDPGTHAIDDFVLETLGKQLGRWNTGQLENPHHHSPSKAPLLQAMILDVGLETVEVGV